MAEENLSKENLKLVLAGLRSEDKPITKKRACEMLGINYNVARLDKLIVTFEETEARRKKLKTAKLGTAITPDEYNEIANSYLEGVAMSEISESIFRGLALVNTAVEEMGLPKRVSGPSYFRAELIPEMSCKTTFEKGEKVWAVRYQSMAVVDAALALDTATGSVVYRIWVVDQTYKHYAYQAAYDLASLDHLKSFGVTLNRKV